MQAWSTLESYSDAEVSLLEALKECTENPSSCSGTMGTTTSNTDTVTMGTDRTKPPVKNDDVSSGAPPVIHLQTSFLFVLIMPLYHSFYIN